MVAYTTTTGTQSINLNLQGVGANAPAEVIIAGVENVAINSSQSANAVDLELSAATALTASGSANLTIAPLSTGGNTINVSSVNASAMTGNLSINMGNQSGVLPSTVISVTGGAGNDSLTMSDLTQGYIATGGAGNDTFVDTNIVVTDSIEGGDGTDTLSTSFAGADRLDATVNGVNGIDVLSFSNALSGSINVTAVDSTINTVTLASNGNLTEAGAALTGGPAGAFTLNMGSTVGGAMNADISVADTGTAVTDSLTINNRSVNSATNTNIDAFAGNNITSTGYENVSLNSGAASNAAGGQTIGTMTITADAASAPVSLTLSGTNSVRINSFASNSTGLSTINASALTAQLTGTETFRLNATALGALGTQSIIGSAGEDRIVVGNFASTIDGGAGNDSITGGTLADSIHGGQGNDNLVGGGGNDTIRGNEGNDTIDALVGNATRAVSIDGGAGNDTVNLEATLVATDIVNGGEGTADTLRVNATVAAEAAVGVTNFEVLRTDGADQIMSNFANNTGFTAVFATGAGVDITNASTTLNTYRVDSTSSGAHSFARLADTGTDSLSLVNFAATGSPGNTTLTAFTANNEESLTIDVSAGADTAPGSLTIDTLNAADLTTLTLTGDHSITIGTIAGAQDLATINAAGMNYNQSTLSINASISEVDMVVTGGSARFLSLETGSGDDSVTGTTGADSIWTNNGDDTVTAGGGADTIRTDGGDDTVSDGTGADTITAGTGTDAVNLTVDGTSDQIRQLSTDSAAASATTFAGATVSAGDSMTFGNGVDVVRNFSAGATASGGDTLQVLVAGAPTTLIGQTVVNLSAGNAVFFASGNFNASTGRFVITAPGVGADTIILQSTGTGASDALTTNASALVLVGVDYDDLVAGNFVGGATSVYTITANSIVTSTTGAITGGGVSAANLLTLGYTTIDGTGFALTVDGALETANLSFNRATGVFTGATNGSVNQLLYTNVSTVNFGSGDDTYTADSLAAGATTVNAGTGVDTLVLNGTRGVGNAVNLGTDGRAVGFENLNASAAGGTVTATLVAGTTSYVSSTAGDTVNLVASNTVITDNTTTAATLTLATGNVANTVTVNNTIGTITATTLDSNLVVNVGDDAGDSITITAGNNSTTVSGASATDTVNIDATATDDGELLTIASSTAGAGSVAVTVLSADLLNTSTGAQNITAALADVATVTVRNSGTGEIEVDANALTAGDVITTTRDAGAGLITVNNLLGDLTNTAGAINLDTDALAGTITLTNNGTGLVTVDSTATADGQTIATAGTGAGGFSISSFRGDLVNTAAGTVAVTSLVDVANISISNTGGTLTVAAEALADGRTLILASGVAADVGVTVTGLLADLSIATDAAATNNITLAAAANHVIDYTAAGSDASINASAKTDGQTITITDTGATAGTTTITSMGLGDLTTTSLAGVLNVTTGAGQSGIGQVFTLGDAGDTINATGLLSNSTIEGGLGADTITLGSGLDRVIFTSGLTSDSITSFTTGAGNDQLAFDISALEAGGAVVAAVTLNLNDGTAATGATTANSLATINNVTAAGDDVAGAAGTVFVVNLTGANYANATAVAAAIVAGGSRELDFTNAIDAANAFVITWTDGTDGYVGLAYSTANVAAGASIAAGNAVVTLIGTLESTSLAGIASSNFVAVA